MNKTFTGALVANIAVLLWVVVRGLSDMAAVDFQDLPWDVLVVVPLAAFVLLRFFGQLVVGGLATRAPVSIVNGHVVPDAPTARPSPPQPLPWAPAKGEVMVDLVGGPFNRQRVPAPPAGETDLAVRLGNSKVVYKLGSDGRWWHAKGS